MCFIREHTRPSQLTNNWKCTCFCATILTETQPETRKAIQSKDGNFSPFPGPFLINGFERVWSWVRSHKRQPFWLLNVLFMKNHNIIISQHLVISIFILWQKILRIISVSLQHYTQSSTLLTIAFQGWLILCPLAHHTLSWGDSKSRYHQMLPTQCW